MAIKNNMYCTCVKILMNQFSCIFTAQKGVCFYWGMFFYWDIHGKQIYQTLPDLKCGEGLQSLIYSFKPCYSLFKASNL